VLAPRRFPQIYLPLIGIGIAALWPLSAYALNPLLLPAAAVLVAAALIVLLKPEYGIAIVVALVPFTGARLPQAANVGVTLPSAPLRALLPLMVFALLGYGLVVRGQDRRPLPAVFLGISLMILAAVVSGFRAIDPSKSISDVFLLVTAAALFVAILNICRTREQLLIVLGGAIAGLLLASVEGVIQQITGVYSALGVVANGEDYGRIQGSFSHPNAFAGYLTILMPVAGAVALTPKLPGTLRLLGAAAIGLAVPSLIFTYSRGALATLIAGAIIWLVVTRPKTAVVVGIVVLLVGAVATPSALKSRFSNSSSNDVSLRTDVANSALDIYEAHPFVGVGIGNFQAAYDDLTFTQAPGQRRLFHGRQLLVPTAAPSQFLNTLSEQGLFGVFALGLFTLQTLIIAYRASKARDPTARAIGLGIGMAIAAAILYSLLETTLQEDQVLSLFALIAIAAIAQGVLGRSTAEPRPTRSTAPARLSEGGASVGGAPA
jgi:O-antigen ligase